MLLQNICLITGDFMRINVSTLFQVIALIAQDVLALEAKDTASSPNQTAPPAATDATTPVDTQPVVTH
ncbi:hypothetical protein [Nostoc sp.]